MISPPSEPIRKSRTSPAPLPESKNSRDLEKPDLKLRRAQLKCIRIALRHYENFFVLGPLTPLSLFPHLAALYAFARHSDDVADEIADASRAAEMLDAWQDELRNSLAEGPSHFITRSLSWTVKRHYLPENLLFDLLSAFKQDLTVHTYPNFEELRNYTRRSADPVGRLVLRLYGYEDPELDVLSDSICTGLQLANFCQDVGEDARRGRIYIPLSECAQFDVDPVEVLDRSANPRMERLLRFQIIRAFRHLRAGMPLIGHLKGKLRISVQLFITGGLQILEKLEKDPLLALYHRVHLTSGQKIRALRSSLKALKS